MSNKSVNVDDTYLIDRLHSLDLSAENTLITLSNGDEASLFSADEEGNIVIHYFNLLGNAYTWKKPGTKWPRPFLRTRLKRPNGDQKYSQDKGSGQHPFFTPLIIQKYQKEEGIETLFIVEGEFKAFKGYTQGLDVIGIPSIHGFYSPELKGKLHEDIEAVIIKCNIKNIVFIADADVLSVHWQEGKDLAKRASSFYAAVKNFRESLQLLIDKPLKLIVFTHILPKFINDGKGLDDLLAKYTAVNSRIIEDLHRFHLATEYFRGFLINDIHTDLNRVFKYLGLNSPLEFYKTCQDFIEDKSFVFRGKNYQWNDVTEELEEIRTETPYIRVGVKYYKKIYTPLADGDNLLNLKEWTRSCIEMDHGRDYVKTIDKFEDWCYVPDHIEFRPSVNGFFNKYFPLRFLPSPGNCGKSIAFIKHIFGEHYELGLDYMQLLYTRPRQILPVLCLVSEERSTGKTTFLNWLTAIFGRNATINRNEDFESQFNSGWAGKLIIAVDETFIDRKKIYERIKSLSTGKTMKVEAKGQDSIDAEFFGKVILCSNNEDSFIPVDSSEIRFWIRKLKPFENENPHLLARDLLPEIPAFLQFLLDRTISILQKTRMWFSPSDIQTAALANIVAKNKSFLEKELTEQLSDYIIDNELEEVKFTLSDLQAILQKVGLREPMFKLKDLVMKKWKLISKNSTYQKYLYNDTGEGYSITAKGRHFAFSRGLLKITIPANPQGVINLNASSLDINKTPVDELTNDEIPF